MAVRGGIWGDSVGNEEEGALFVRLGRTYYTFLNYGII